MLIWFCNIYFVWSRYIPSILFFVFRFKYIVNSIIGYSKDVALRYWKSDGNDAIVNHQLKKWNSKPIVSRSKTKYLFHTKSGKNN